MKILLVNGSPRENGVSSKLAANLLSKLGDHGNEIQKYNVNSLNMHGCQECFYCRKNKTDVCAINDDLSEILELVKKTEVLIISTPVFYGDISAQLKCFVDRTWSYYGITGVSADHLPKNRSLVFIQSYGYADDNIYNSLFEKYKSYFNMFGFDNCYLIKAYGSQYSSPEIVNEHEVMEAIEDTAAKLKSVQ
ncbi:MAG: flavodoxin family protein [Clostridia bacterium]|nr:flavodoxin family protein [Clostridia bacterium]